MQADIFLEGLIIFQDKSTGNHCRWVRSRQRFI